MARRRRKRTGLVSRGRRLARRMVRNAKGRFVRKRR